MGSSKSNRAGNVGNKCATPGCRRKVRRARDGKFCTTCGKRNWRKANPMKASYETLKYNSTRRKVYFDLTFEEFKELCYETNYMAGKGRSRLSHTLDRIIEGKTPGYTYMNIRVLPKGINSQKEAARRKNKTLIYDWQTGTATVI
jgi:hypothetical protein